MSVDKIFFDKLNAPYYLLTYPYRENSGGVRAMHYLCHALNLAGEEAYALADGIHPGLRTPQLTDAIREQHAKAGREPIVIYPEVVGDNPLKARNIVRYLLNRPGALSEKPLEWLTSDLIYSHGPDIIPDGISAPILQTPLINGFIYNANGVASAKRRGKLLWIHRYLDRGGELTAAVEGATEISYRVPNRTPEELRELYRNAEVLYTYEASTACYEAMLCGCPVVYLPNPVMLPEPPAHYLGREGWAWGDSSEQIAFAQGTIHLAAANYRATQQAFWQQLRKFVEATQAYACESDDRSAGKLLFLPDDPLTEAISAYNENRLGHATKLLMAYLDAGGEPPLAFAYLAFICATQGLHDEADDFIAQAMNLAPDRPEFIAALGEAFLKAGHAKEARVYLMQAIRHQPDLFFAYPALAESMRQEGDIEEAIHLLQSATLIPSSAQEGIFTSLCELLTLQGNIAAIGELCRRRADPTAQALSIVMASRGPTPVEDQLSAIAAFQARFLPPPGIASQANPNGDVLTLGFLVSNLEREGALGRLEALLSQLPAVRYRTILLDNDPSQTKADDVAIQRLFLVCDHWLNIDAQNDEQVATSLARLPRLDILVDTDGIAVRHRLPLFRTLPVRIKASWARLPVLDTDTAIVASEAVPDISGPSLQASRRIRLPGLGLNQRLPDTEIRLARQDQRLRFACLTPVLNTDQTNWYLFAEILTRHEGSTLTVNLAGLGNEARQFLNTIFAERDVTADRLRYIDVSSPQALCHAWNQADIGLAPIGDNGEKILTTCLWMDRPYIAFASDAPWSAFPAALLGTVGLGDLVAFTVEDYLEHITRLVSTPPPSGLRAALEAAMPTAKALADAFDAAVQNLQGEKTL